MRSKVLLFLPLAACIDTSEPVEHQDITSDELAAAAATITIRSDQPLELALVRDGASGRWRRPTQIGATEYRASVRGAYTVMTACSGSVSVLAQTPADSVDVVVTCAVGTLDPTPVSGTMVQPGTVSVGFARQSSSLPNWAYQIEVERGTYDIVATTADRLAVQRGLEVTGPTTVPPLDLTNATPFSFATFTPTNSFPGETAYVSTFLVSPRIQPQAQLYRGPMTGAKVAPASLLTGDLVQEVSLRSERFDETTFEFRSARRPFVPGDETSVTFWDPVRGAAYSVVRGDPTLSWTSRSAVDYLFLSLSSFDGYFFDMTATKRFLDATRVSRLSFDFDAPGMKPEWIPTLTNQYDMSLTAQRGTTRREGYIFQQTFNLGTVPPGAALTAPRAKSRVPSREQL